MDIRRTWAARDADFEATWQTILSRAQQRNKVTTGEAWSAAISFQRPTGSTGYLASGTDIILGVLPFYDLLYVPISFHIKDEDDFRRGYGIDTGYFLDLAEARRVIPVFPAMSNLYPNFVVNRIWSYLEVRRLRCLLAPQINTLCVAF